jgi:hypothetical protein
MKITKGYTDKYGNPQVQYGDVSRLTRREMLTGAAAMAAYSALPACEPVDDDLDWPPGMNVPPEYLGEPMALWSQAVVPPGSVAEFQSEALRNPHDDAFFEVHSLLITNSSPVPQTNSPAPNPLLTMGFTISLVGHDGKTFYPLTKDLVAGNMLYGIRGSPFSPFGVYVNSYTFTVDTIEVRFAKPWLVGPRQRISAGAVLRGAYSSAVTTNITFRGRKVPQAHVRQASTTLPYLASYQFQPTQFGNASSLQSSPTDLANVTGQDVTITNLVGAISYYGYSILNGQIATDDLEGSSEVPLLFFGGAVYFQPSPADITKIGLTMSDGYPVIPIGTPLRTAFSAMGRDWSTNFVLRPNDFLIAQSDITAATVLPVGTYTVNLVPSLGMIGHREVSL